MTPTDDRDDHFFPNSAGDLVRELAEAPTPVLAERTQRYTLRAHLTDERGRPLTGPTVYAYRHRHGEAGQAVGPDHPEGQGYLEVHLDLDAEEQWLSGDVEVDGRRRYLRPFHRGVIERGAIVRLRVVGDEVVVEAPDVVTPPDPPPTGRPDLRLRVNADGSLSGEGVHNGVLVGAGCYLTVTYPCHLGAVAQRLEESGVRIYRTFTQLARYGGMPTAQLVIPWRDPAAYELRAVTLADELTRRGIRLLLCVLDEESRASRAPSPYNERNADGTYPLGPWGSRRPSASAAVDVARRLCQALTSFGSEILPEAYNEPTDRDRAYEVAIVGELRRLGFVQPVSVGAIDRKVETIPHAKGGIIWEHVWPSWQVGGRLPRSQHGRIVAHLADIRRANPGAHVGLSTDGIRGSSVEDPGELARAVTGAGHSLEWMTADRTPDAWSDADRREVDAVVRGAGG